MRHRQEQTRMWTKLRVLAALKRMVGGCRLIFARHFIGCDVRDQQLEAGEGDDDEALECSAGNENRKVNEARP